MTRRKAGSVELTEHFKQSGAPLANLFLNNQLYGSMNYLKR